ncbi:MAG TPA: sulfurtransferase [Acidobacteria bacterium]|nr:sulfurtransferase [Acidobacteriota bacterium]
MSAPFFKFGAFGDEASLVVAFAIGIGFGFFLERAGFGSARKLTDQFYLKDLAVLKVMFTAIVTAMLGIFYLSWMGFMDLSLVYFGSTYLVPQIVGGLILGVGFVVGGYCPGTSVVALATGKLDALVFLAGVTVGIFGFGEAWPAIAGFVNSTDLGPLTLPQAFGLRYGLVVFLVVVAALGAFKGAEAVERRMARREGAV